MSLRRIKLPPLTPQHEAVLAYVREHPGTTIADIAHALEMTWEQVSVRIDTLTHREIVDRRSGSNRLGDRVDTVRIYAIEEKKR